MQPYYEHAGITIYHGDCLEVMPTLPDQSFDAIITDPPYGTTACAWDSVIPFAPMWAELKRLIKPRGAIVLFGSQPFTSALVMSNPGMFRYEWIWEKDKATGFLDANRRPLKEHENILCFASQSVVYLPQKTTGHRPANYTRGNYAGIHSQVYRGEIKENRTGGQTDRFPRSIIRFNSASKESKQLHPTQKPLALLEYLVSTYTNPCDTVLDFTCGSGTTLRAAKNLNRRAVGIEIEERYCALAARRLQQEVMDLV